VTQEELTALMALAHTWKTNAANSDHVVFQAGDYYAAELHEAVMRIVNPDYVGARWICGNG